MKYQQMSLFDQENNSIDDHQDQDHDQGDHDHHETPIPQMGFFSFPQNNNNNITLINPPILGCLKTFQSSSISSPTATTTISALLPCSLSISDHHSLASSINNNNNNNHSISSLGINNNNNKHREDFTTSHDNYNIGDGTTQLLSLQRSTSNLW